MKIHKIEFENINSYKGHYCIDFDSTVFTDNQFVIQGEMGAGKSTIFDVITLALYGRTPRQESIFDGSNDDDNKKGDKKNTPKKNEIMNKLSGECMASVTYSAPDVRDKKPGKIVKYCSTYSQHRAGYKPNGNLQDPKFEISIDDEELAYASEKSGKKIAEITAKIIGLTYAQFVSSVIIPQGEFDKFLSSSGRDKAEILAKVSGTSYYKEIGKQLCKTANEKEKEYNDQKGERDAIKLLSEEEEKGLNNELTDLNRLVDENNSNINLLAKKLEKLTKAEEAKKEYVNASNEKETFDKEYASFDSQRIILKNSQKAEKCVEKKVILDKCIGDKNTESQNLDKAIKDLEEILKLLSGTESKLEEAEKLLTEQKNLEDSKKQLWDKVKELDVNVKNAKTQKSEAEKDYNNKLRDYEKNKKEYTVLKEKEKNLSEAQKFNEDYLEENKNDEGLVGVIANLKSKSNTLKDLLNDIASHENSKITLHDKIQQETSEQEELQEEKRNLQEQLYQLVDRNHVYIASIMRERLEPGKACPVCGSKNHVRCEKIEEESLDISEKNKVAENVAVLSNALEENDKNLSKVETELNKDRDKLPEIEGEIVRFKNKKNELIEDINTRIEPWSKKLDETQGDIGEQADGIIVSLQALYDKFNDTKSKKERNEREISDIKTTLAGLNLLDKEKLVEEAKTKKEQAETELEALTAERQEIFGSDDVKVEEKKFKDSIQKLEDNLEQIKEENGKYSRQESGQNAAIKALKNNLKKLEDDITKAEKDFNNTLSENGFTTVVDFEAAQRSPEEINKLSEQDSKLEEEKIRLEERLNSAEKRYKETGADQMNDISVENLKNEKQALEEENKQKIERRGQITEQLRLNSEEKARWNNEDAKLKNLEPEKNIYVAIRDLIGINTGEDFQTFVQKIAMKNLIVKANRYMKMIQDKYELVSKENSMDVLISEDGVIRPISNVSGGEKFCISLSLALGISELSGKNGTVEALFLDEGFGSLSGQPLLDAVEALKNLSSTGKMLGIVTHIREVINEFDENVRMKAVNKKGVSRLSGPGVSEIL